MKMMTLSFIIILITLNLFAQEVPQRPEHVTIQWIPANNAWLLTWDFVTQDTTGAPITICAYNIYKLQDETLWVQIAVVSPLFNHYVIPREYNEEAKAWYRVTAQHG